MTRTPAILAVVLGMSAVGMQAYAEEGSAARRALAVELLETTGERETPEQISDMMLSILRQNYETMVEQRLAAQPSLTQEERAAVERRLANFDRFASTFSSLLSEELDIDALVEEIYVPLYMEHFTEAELREILAFRRSPVGRKETALMPVILQEGMRRMLPRIQPAVMSVAHDALAQEQALALQEAP